MTPCKIASHLALVLPLATVAHADTTVLILDISSSTPITQPAFLRTVLPMLSEHISTNPVGSRIKVFTVGDDKAGPVNLELWVQRGKDVSGDTAKNLAVSVPAAIGSYLNRVRSDPKMMQGESSLTPAFLDASKWCQPAKPCRIIFLTDGMEFQPGVLMWPSEIHKPLLPIPGLDLKGADIFMYGIGQGVSSKARIAAEQHWQAWLKTHNAGSVDLRRL